MRVVFMGTPEFAVPALRKLAFNSHHHLVTVVTTIDKSSGRGKKINSSPIKLFAVEYNLPLIQVENLRDTLFLNMVSSLYPDIFVVVAFRILPPELFSIPSFGAVNLHASLLPKYRGAAPIQWALINGENVTGVTTFKIDNGIDTGSILLQQEVKIFTDETAGALSGRLAEIGADLIIETLNKLETNTIKPKPQKSDEGSRAPKITPEMSIIDWNKPAQTIVNLIRGLSPKPAAYTHYGQERFKIYKAQVIHVSEGYAAAGVVLTSNPKSGLVVKASQNAVNILMLQREGKRIMTAREFLRGVQISEGAVLH